MEGISSASQKFLHFFYNEEICMMKHYIGSHFTLIYDCWIMLHLHFCITLQKHKPLTKHRHVEDIIQNKLEKKNKTRLLIRLTFKLYTDTFKQE